MNIFFLSNSPVTSAEMMVDKHVVKMILETAQLLSTAHRLLDGTEGFRQVEVPVYQKNPENRRQYLLDENGKYIQIGTKIKDVRHWFLPDHRESIIYSATHRNHPSAVWCRESVSNYNWLVDHFFALGDVYTKRYDKVHGTITKLGYELQCPPNKLKQWDWTDPPSCMDDEFIISKSPIENYRNYYANGKTHLHKWQKSKFGPDWIYDYQIASVWKNFNYSGEANAA